MTPHQATNGAECPLVLIFLLLKLLRYRQSPHHDRSQNTQFFLVENYF